MMTIVFRSTCTSTILLLIAIFAVNDAAAKSIRASSIVVRPSILGQTSWGVAVDELDLDRLLLTRRGGASDEDDEDEDEYDDESESEEEESDDEDDELMEGFDMDDSNEADFAEGNYATQLMDEYKKTPPLTKGYLTASFAVTMLGYLTNKNQFPSYLTLEWKYLKSGQIWRPFTAFLNFGGFGLGYALTVQFVWMYMSTLERLHHHKPYDFWIMFIFGMIAMLVGYPVLKMSPKLLGHNLSTFFVYVWSRYHEGTQVDMFGLFNTQAELLPWVFLMQTFLLEGEIPVLDLLGIAFGHIYHHLATVGIVRAPKPLVSWYKNGKSAKFIRKQYKKISSDFEVVDEEEEEKA